MTWRNVWCIHNATSVVGPGLGGLRDGSGTESGMSHTNAPANLHESWGFYTSHAPCMLHAQTIC